MYHMGVWFQLCQELWNMVICYQLVELGLVGELQEKLGICKVKQVFDPTMYTGRLMAYWDYFQRDTVITDIVIDHCQPCFVVWRDGNVNQVPVFIQGTQAKDIPPAKYANSAGVYAYGDLLKVIQNHN